MRAKFKSEISAYLLAIALLLAAPRRIAAQDQQDQDQQHSQSSPAELWPWLKQGQLSFNVRYRFEAFERDGAPFTATAYAPTLRLALGYETPAFHGFSLFAHGEAVIVTGPADYSDPLVPLKIAPIAPPSSILEASK